MSGEGRLERLTRGAKRGAGGWAEVQAPHPGVRDPRSIRVGHWPTPVNAAIIASCALVTAFAILSAWSASPVGTPGSWARWTAESRALSLEHPEGWAVRNIGSEEHLHVIVMRSAWVRVHVVSEEELATAAGLYARLSDEDARYRALEMLHRSTGQTWASFFGELDEGDTGRTVIGRHRAVWSQFKYAGTALEGGEPMTGYRATIMGERHGAIASAVAPSDHWREFKPIALRILRSIRFGER